MREREKGEGGKQRKGKRERGKRETEKGDGGKERKGNERNV